MNTKLPTTLIPQLNQQQCLNSCIPKGIQHSCTRCYDICPADAIDVSESHIPEIDNSACTGCTACVSICPIDAIKHEQFNPTHLTHQAKVMRTKGCDHLSIQCSAVQHRKSDANIPCHAMWNSLLLASIAAEGTQTLHLIGIDQCKSCSMQHGASIMKQVEKDYTTLNYALNVHLDISWQEDTQENHQTNQEAEPARRAFFRNLLPSITQSAITAAAQINHQISNQDDKTTPKEDVPLLPTSLALFVQALPKLEPNFTPIPNLPSLPMGAIQATDSCTACGECVQQCPTKALYIKEFGANSILEFKPHHCIGCNQCVDICPEDAIESLPSISLPAIATKRSRPLIMVANVQDNK